MNKNKKIAIAGTAVLFSGSALLYYLKHAKGARIIKLAKGFVGQKEIAPNRGFVNPVFQSMMRSLGLWLPGAEWCASFARMVWLMVLKGRQKNIANKLLSPSTQRTYSGFEKDRSGLFSVGQKPISGSIVIWRSKSNQAKGHAGIYIGKLKGLYWFIEGNRRNAVTVTKYKNYKQISTNLYLRGFIYW